MLDYEKIKSEILSSNSLGELADTFKPPVPKCADDENYVFISYSHKDYKAVYCDLLEYHKAGVRYWYDFGLPAGEEWDKVVESKIKGSGCAGVVFYLSENLFLSRSVNKEIEFTYGDGETDGKKYFCVNLSGMQPTKIMKQLIRKNDDDELEKFGLDDRMVDLLHAFSDRSTYMNKGFDSDVSHIEQTVAQMIKQFNVVVTGNAITDNDSAQELREMLDFASTFAIKRTTLIKYLGNAETVVVPDYIEIIGDDAFKECTDLRNVTLPETVTHIGSEAFADCRRLESINIPNKVVTLGKEVFRDCQSLKSIRLPDSLDLLGDKAFLNCYDLTDVIFPPILGELGGETFRDCCSLTHIELPSSMEYIGMSCFEGCTELKSVNFGNSLVTLCDKAFKDCKKLEKAILPDTTKWIRKQVFNGCSSLSELYLGAAIEHIDYFAFLDCRKLRSITASNDNPEFFASGNCLINRAKKTVILGCVSSVIPDDGSVTCIGAISFAGITALEQISIPKSVTSIESEAFTICTHLLHIHFGGTMFEWQSVKKGDYWDEMTGRYTVHCTDGDIAKA